MPMFGYTLMSEMHDPRDLVRRAVRAEEAGFDFLVISDHIHPWLSSHHHSPFAWSVLGAVADRTERVELATLVTCPFVRYHPAVIAQAAATIGVMSEGRFTLGVGAGERLNEHVVGLGWPSVTDRHDMLREAVEAMKALWSGDWVTYRGEHITVEDARIYDLPDAPPRIYMGASGGESARLAAEVADGICAVEPLPSLVQAFTEAGGDAGNTWAQIPLSWGPDADAAKARAHDQFRFGVPGWKVMAELPNPVNFDKATETVRPDDVAQSVPCGPDVEAHAQGIRQYLDAGYQRVAVVDLGEDEDGFFRFWREQLAPALR